MRVSIDVLPVIDWPELVQLGPELSRSYTRDGVRDDGCIRNGRQSNWAIACI